MTLIRDRQSANEAVDEINEFFKEPLLNVSKFYVYKYLVDEADAEEIEFDLMQLTNTMKDVLYNYSIYAASKEAANANRKFKFGIYEPNQLFTKNSRRLVRRMASSEGIPEEEALEKIEDMASEFNEVIEDNTNNYEKRVIDTFVMTSDPPLNMKTGGEEKVRRDLNKLSKRLDIGDPGVPYLESLQTFFGTDWNGIIRSETIMDGGGWQPNYGGDAWASVCQTAQLYEEFGREAFVDIMLSVEHNNGNFLDKWPTPTNKPIEQASEVFFPQVTLPRGMPSRVSVVPDILDLILSLARDTDLYELWRLAKTDRRELRRYESDIPDNGGRIELGENKRMAVINRP